MFKLSMPSIPVETSNVLFDVSRLYRSRNRKFATGVDRIDLAIGIDFLQRFGDLCHFLYSGPLGSKILPYGLGAALLSHLEAKWHGGKTKKPPFADPFLLLRGASKAVNSDTTYVAASHSGLGKVRGAMSRLDPDKTMRRILYLHDIIPLEMPEYQRPQTYAAFQSYLRELTDARVTIVSNSLDTDMRVRRLAKKEAWPVETFLVRIPFMEQLAEKSAGPRASVETYLADPRPFFTVLGTIEPRKNHLLLLNLWRQFAWDGIEAPRLCIIGKRGWENENILDMLDRCMVIRETVTEFGDLRDHEVRLLMQRSSALLFPSFIEGLGLPLLEAAALDVPCIASDIPVFREVAQPGTLFLDPLDGPGWKRAILSRVSQV